METGSCVTSRETVRLSSAHPQRISPPTRAVTIGGRLGAIGVDGQVLPLWLGLEIGAGFGQHIGEVYISEGTVGIEGCVTSHVAPGPPEPSWQPWEPSPVSVSLAAAVQGCRCRAAGL